MCKAVTTLKLKPFYDNIFFAVFDSISGIFLMENISYL